ncbi:MAG TPA: GTPase-activating protein, partial [Geobacteraceae bacterium]
LIDIKTLLEKLKSDQLNGCLRIYTEDRTAIIFYKEGAPLGFFHDGSQDIETTAGESQKIATLPGAKVDVLSTKSADELMGYDLMEVVNITKIWDTALAKHQAHQESQRKEVEERDRKAINAKLAELEDDLKEIVAAYLGKVGKNLVEKELNDNGGRQCLLDKNGLAKFLAGIEKGAKLLTSMTKLQEMLKTLEGEIANRTGN